MRVVVHLWSHLVVHFLRRNVLHKRRVLSSHVGIEIRCWRLHRQVASISKTVIAKLIKQRFLFVTRYDQASLLSIHVRHFQGWIVNEARR